MKDKEKSHIWEHFNHLFYGLTSDPWCWDYMKLTDDECWLCRTDTSTVRVTDLRFSFQLHRNELKPTDIILKRHTPASVEDASSSSLCDRPLTGSRLKHGDYLVHNQPEWECLSWADNPQQEASYFMYYYWLHCPFRQQQQGSLNQPHN